MTARASASLPAARFDVTGPVPALAGLGPVHLIAIGGAGMSAVAGLLLQRGTRVSGSDAPDSAALRALRELGAAVHVGHDPSHLGDARTVVVSSAVRDDNVELAAARERGLRVLHRSQALAALMAGSRTAAVAGANGKTTTTAMLVVALRAAGADPGFAVGGEPVQLGTNAGVGGGRVFVAEADESDGSFLAYRPDVAVVTNVQPDHLDFYGTFAAVESAYDAFARSVPPGGLLVACADDAGSARLATAARERGARVVTYGVHPEADVRLDASAGAGLGGSARLHDGGAAAQLRLAVPGRHNLLDAAAAYATATHGFGADPERVLEGLAGFAGTRRRFEPVGEAAGVRVVDDYAHNPGKLAALVETARSVAGQGRLVVAFQPHLYSRTRDFAAEFAAALARADAVVVTDVYAAREDPVRGISGATVADLVPAAAVAGGRPGGEPAVRYVPDLDNVAAALAALAGPGDLVVTVGAGDITTAGPRLLDLLRESGVGSASLGHPHARTPPQTPEIGSP